MSNMFFSEKCPAFVREIMTELGKEESREHWKEALVQAAEHELESQLGEGACIDELLYRLLAHIDTRLLDTKETAIDLAYIAFDIAMGNQKNRLPGTYDSLRVHFDNAVEALAADAAATKPKDGCNPPWRKSPKVVSAPPSRASSPTYIKNWKPQPPGSVVPDEVKQPGMEKHRFDLIDWRLNGFECRLQELDREDRRICDEAEQLILSTVRAEKSIAGLTAELQALQARFASLESAHESLHNTCWKQSHDIGSRLEALENRAPC